MFRTEIVDRTTYSESVMAALITQQPSCSDTTEIIIACIIFHVSTFANVTLDLNTIVEIMDAV